MSSFKEMVKGLMLSYPLSDPTPLHAAACLFTSSIHHNAWVNGELVCDYEDQLRRDGIDLSDLEGRLAADTQALAELPDDHSMRPFYATRILESQHAIHWRRFVLEHIDTLASGPCTAQFNHPEPQTGILRDISDVRSLVAFNFPDDIRPDWANALRDFLVWWQTRLNLTYIPYTNGEDTLPTWWPSDAKRAFLAIREALVRLHFVTTGETDEQRRIREKQLMDELLADVRAQA